MGAQANWKAETGSFDGTILAGLVAAENEAEG